MKRTTLLVMVLTAIVPVIVMAAPGDNTRTSGRTNRTDRTSRSPATPAADSVYQTITTKNIFISDRTVRVTTPRVDTGPRIERYTPPRPEKVLTGIALQSDSPIAFFEDPQSGETLRITVGSVLDDGTVTEISFEGVTYRTSKGTRNIHVGETVSGTAASLYSPSVEASAVPAVSAVDSASPSAATTQPTTASTTQATSEPSTGPAVSTENMSIEERMRLRRLKEQ